MKFVSIQGNPTRVEAHRVTPKLHLDSRLLFRLCVMIFSWLLTAMLWHGFSVQGNGDAATETPDYFKLLRHPHLSKISQSGYSVTESLPSPIDAATFERLRSSIVRPGFLNLLAISTSHISPRNRYRLAPIPIGPSAIQTAPPFSHPPQLHLL